MSHTTYVDGEAKKDIKIHLKNLICKEEESKYFKIYEYAESIKKLMQVKRGHNQGHNKVMYTTNPNICYRCVLDVVMPSNMQTGP